MAIPQGQLSSQVVEDTYLAPEGGAYQLLEDIESGPVDVEDTSEGLDYQDWVMTYDGGTGDFTLTPDVGAPSVPLSVMGVERFTFTFDQNGRVYIAYQLSGGDAYFWWYDSLVAMKVTTNLNTLYGAGTGQLYAPTCHLDDRRQMEFANNDILLFWTEPSATTGYELFMSLQRERFQTAYSLKDEIVQRYIHRCGMHRGLRLQIGMGVQ